MLNNFLHPCLDHKGEVFYRDLLRLTAAQAGHAHNLILLVLFSQGRPEPYFQLFGNIAHHRAALADILGYAVSAEWDNSGMADDPLLENGHIGGAAANIHQYNAGLFFLITQHRLGRRQRLQYQLLAFKTGFVNAFYDIFYSRNLARYNMEVSLKPHTRHANGIFDTRFVIHRKLLR